MTKPLLISWVSILVACGGGGEGGVPPDGLGPVAACDGNELVLAGAVTLTASSAGTVTVDDRLVGVTAAVGGDLASFAVRRLGDDIDAIGSHDVSTFHMKFLRQPSGADCDVPDACEGFIALAGTLDVTATTPRYQATFTLSELHDRPDTTDELGPAIPGTVTGCIDVDRPQ